MGIGRTRMLRPQDRRVGPGVAVAWMVLAATLAYVPAASASVVVQINVPADVATIQGAIDIASPGDTVVVAPGTFHERIDFKGKAIEVRSSAGPSSTTIDGDELSEVVRFHTGEGRGSILRGFTITGGVRYYSIFGAGVQIVKASPTIVGNVVTGNHVDGSAGGGIGAYQGSALIQNNHVFGNSSSPHGVAGGIAADGTAEILGNLIEGNLAGGGGGVLIADEVVLANNIIRNNRAMTYHGGGVSIAGGSSRVVQNLITGNTADIRGGGIFWSETGPTDSPVAANNTVVGNQAPDGSAMAGESGGMVIANNVVVGTGTSSTVECVGAAALLTEFHHTNIYGEAPIYEGCPDPTGTSGNISADPRLVDAAGASPDYRLQPGSPSIDAGLSFAAGFDFDIVGLPRTTDGDGDGTAVVDMGAYEAPTLVRHVSQIPYTVWAQPTAVPLDGIGNWVYPVNEPAATDGQLPPAWFYAHYFGFESGGASAQVGLVTKPDGKFAVFSVFEANGTAHNAVIAFDWTAGRFYFPFVFQVSPGTWGAWVYDDAAGTWTPIGALTLPAAWGKLAPASITAVTWLGPTAGACATYPRADVAVYAPFGYVGAAGSVAAVTSNGAGAGECPPVSSVDGPWARYVVGAD